MTEQSQDLLMLSIEELMKKLPVWKLSVSTNGEWTYTHPISLKSFKSPHPKIAIILAIESEEN